MKAGTILLLLSVAGSIGLTGAAAQTVAAVVPPTDPPSGAGPGTVSPTPAALPAGQDLRKRVAIDAFDYSSVIPAVQLIFNPDLDKKKKNAAAPVTPNVGAGIQAMLIQRLSEAGKVVIVDKDKLAETKKMQEEAMSNRNQQGKGPGVGRIRAPDLLLSGDIVVFGRDDKTLGVGGGGVSRLCPLCGISIHKEEDKAVVKVTYKITDERRAR